MQGDFEEKEVGPLSESDRSSRERRVFGAFLVLGVFALVFGFLQILNGIRKPFDLSASSNTNEAAAGDTLAALRQKDVDNDGLNDYDELYTYRTSPYLNDSDSDGVTDASEISAGSDPNCPTGKVCTPIGALGPATNTNVNGTAATTTANVNTASAALTVNDLRETLRNAGAPAATLDAMSDDELKALYKEVTGQEFTQTTATNTNAASVNAATNAATNSATNQSAGETPGISSVDIAALRGLSVDQIKEFLINGGADPATLEGLDDATMQVIFQQALDELEKSNGL